MAITYVDSTTNGATTGTAVSVDKPTGVGIDDLVLCILHINGPKTSVDNNGANPFSEILVDRSYNGPSAQVDVYYRRLTGAEGSTFDFTLSASDRWCIVAIAFRGVDLGTIWDVAPTSTTENTGTGSTNTTDSLTTTVDNAMIVSFAVNDSSSVTFTATPGDSFTTPENNSGEQLLSVAYKLFGAAGTQSAVSWTQSASNGTWLNNIFSLKPFNRDFGDGGTREPFLMPHRRSATPYGMMPGTSIS